MDVDNTDFLEFVAAADAQKLDYILIGGLALILNGAVRFTQDADIWIQPTNENRDRFVGALLTFGYDESEVHAMRSADFTQPQIVRIHEFLWMYLRAFTADLTTPNAGHGRKRLF